MKDIIIFGTGNQAKVVTDLIKQMGTHNIVGYYHHYIEEETIVNDMKVICNEKSSHRLREIPYGFIAIGNGYYRKKMVDFIQDIHPTMTYPILQHPFTCIHPDVSIGEGTLIMPGCIINVGCNIGKHALINTRASLDHDTVIEDYASIAPGVVTGGNVVVGHCSWVGLGSSVIQECKIGKHTVIGAGSTVIKNIPEYTLAFGVPCKVQGKRGEMDPYL